MALYPFKPQLLFGRRPPFAANAFKPPEAFGLDWNPPEVVLEAPVNVTPPVITGTTELTGLLTLSSAGIWTGSPTPDLTFQWRVNGSDVVDEEGTTFDKEANLVEDEDEVECRVTATNTEGSAFEDSNTITIVDAGDTMPPTLSLPLDVANFATAATGGVTTDEGNGTLYWVVSTASNAPSKAQVKAGQMHTGAAAADDGSQSVSGSGAQVLSPAPSGLTAETQYYIHFMHEDAEGNQSDVVSGDGFITTQVFGTLLGTLQGSNNDSGTTLSATGSVAVLVGDLVYFLAVEQNDLTAGAVPTDNLGNTYAALTAGDDGGTVCARAYYARVTNAGTLTSITVSTSASTNNNLALAQVLRGPFATSPLDANPVNTVGGSTTTLTCPATGTLAQAAEVVACFAATPGNTGFTATSPNLESVELASQASVIAVLGYQTVAATTTVTPLFTKASPPGGRIMGTASFMRAA